MLQPPGVAALLAEVSKSLPLNLTVLVPEPGGHLRSSSYGTPAKR
jgi:hypothetical protein